ncbi:MAG: Ca2+-binding EF-hand superfamily protein, partial [Planctomycetota bacterium]
FKHNDVDGSGFLFGDEVEVGGSGFDRDRDGRISMLELAAQIGMLSSGASVASEPAVELKESRKSYDGDLARLLDRVNPWNFDSNRNRSIDRAEMERAVMAALDLNDDGALSMDEYSRAPGAPREIRFGDEAAEKIFGADDANGDGEIRAREFELSDALWNALEETGTGEVVLDAREVSDTDKARGWLSRTTEWPKRRIFFSALPPVVTTEQLLAIFDADRDGSLTRRELIARPDLFREFDGIRDGLVSPEKLSRAVERVARDGVELVSDGFLHRWDIDGDGEVEASELPDWALGLLERRTAGR